MKIYNNHDYHVRSLAENEKNGIKNVRPGQRCINTCHNNNIDSFCEPFVVGTGKHLKSAFLCDDCWNKPNNS